MTYSNGVAYNEIKPGRILCLHESMALSKIRKIYRDKKLYTLYYTLFYFILELRI